MDNLFHPPCGDIQGYVDGDVVRASGIPYATATRFQAPTPFPDWSECLDASKLSPMCPQPPVSPLVTTMVGMGASFCDLPHNEHCQNLSITLPKTVSSNDKLPVMVFIHGGSYIQGAADGPNKEPSTFVSEQNIIFVSVGYRLGLFGYLGNGKTKGKGNRIANLGLLDQIQALYWVQRNISAFGGDPDCVTVCGQSAGGDAVAHLLLIPNASKLMCRAIIQSAPLAITKGRRRMNRDMALASDTLTIETPVSEIVDMTNKLSKQKTSYGNVRAMPFSVQYGYDPLPKEKDVDSTYNAMAQEIPILIGSTKDEASAFIPGITSLNAISHVPIIGRRLSRFFASFITHVLWTRSNKAFAARYNKAGGSAVLYNLEYSAPSNPYGSPHGIDLPLLFGNEQIWKDAAFLKGDSWSTTNEKGKRIRQIWADFARGKAPEANASIPGLIRFQRP